MQDVNEITDRWRQEQEQTTDVSDQVEHNQFKTIFFRDGLYTYSYSLCLKTKGSIMWQIVFATENGVIDPPKGI